jgi:hypothetical protein
MSSKPGGWEKPGSFIDEYQTPRSGPWAGQDPSPGLVLLLRPGGRKLLLQFLPHALIHLLELFQSVCTGRENRQMSSYTCSWGRRMGLSPKRACSAFCDPGSGSSLVIGDRAGGEGTSPRVTARPPQPHRYIRSCPTPYAPARPWPSPSQPDCALLSTAKALFLPHICTHQEMAS